MPTILSRLRPYRFLKRSEAGEKEVLQRVFRASLDDDNTDTKLANSHISAYLDSFLPANMEKLYPLAAWFIVALARIAAMGIKKNRKEIPEIINAIGERYAPIAETTGLERSMEISVIVKKLHEQSENFNDDCFSRFLKICLDMVSEVTRDMKNPHFIVYNEIFKKYIGETDAAVNILNQNTTLALEALLYKLKTAMITGGQHG